MDYEGQLTADDMVASYRFHKRRRLRPWRAVQLWLLVFFIAFAFFQVVPVPRLDIYMLLGPLVLLSGALLVILPVLARRRIRRIYAGSRGLQAHFRTTVNADGFHTSTDKDESRRTWTDFCKWKEDNQYFLLYESPDAYRVIPKRVLGTPDRITELRGVFNKYLGAAA